MRRNHAGLTCLLLLGLIAPVVILGGDAAPEVNQVKPGSESGPATATIPPIDVKAPKTTTTATFGLG